MPLEAPVITATRGPLTAATLHNQAVPDPAGRAAADHTGVDRAAAGRAGARYSVVMEPSGQMLPVEGHRLTGISPRAFQHPADRAATAALGSIPYLDTVVRKLVELGYERALRQSYLGSAVRLSEEQLGDVWREHAIAYATLDMAEVPDLYLTQYPSPNAMAIGSKRPIVVVQSELVSLLDVGQRRAVFAHEAAHILADHQLYRTALYILMLLTRTSRLLLPLAPIRTALMEWERATELSADRAAALVTRDPLTVCRTLMCLSAGAMVQELDLDVFMRQGLDYTEKGSGLERLTRLLIDLGVSHPMPVKRTRELMAWVRSGEFDRIVAGEYPTRDEPVDARAEGSDAVSHYSERFRDAFREAGESINSVGQELAGWLRGSGGGRRGGGRRRRRGGVVLERGSGASHAGRSGPPTSATSPARSARAPTARSPRGGPRRGRRPGAARAPPSRRRPGGSRR